VRLVAYYANLMLISSFLGLGIGAMVSARGDRLFRLLPVLFAANILLLLWIGGGTVSLGGAGEFRFGATQGKFGGYAALLVIFSANAAMFTPLGQAIGVQFARLPTLRAYAWDLAGSLTGTLVFGLFSLWSFSPLFGFAAVAVIILALGGRPGWLLRVAACGVAVGAIWFAAAKREVFWSPYYYITVGETYLQTETPAPGQFRQFVAERPPGKLPADLKTMRDPPVFQLHVNQDFYQMHGTVDLARYSPEGWRHAMISKLIVQYSLPYHVIKPPARVLVLGSGGGMDVETALLHGATHVDAVEIDPQIPVISQRINSANPYGDPRVTLHVNDGRAFLQQCTATYDLVAFGYLDSQALFSYGASLRLDGYIYTVESFRQAYSLVRPDGALVVWFFSGHEWLAQKLVQMVEQATGLRPCVYVSAGAIAIIAPRGPLPRQPPAKIADWEFTAAPEVPVDLATDDWPYLYLERQGIPADYAIVIGLLLAVSVAAVARLRGPGFGATDGHFFFMGWGFLLLQTKSIGDCSLYFGATWLVTMLVITGVLLMVLLANWVALRFLRTFQPWFFVPLFLSLLLLLLVPKEAILAQSLGLRLAWTLLAVPLPVFFAGLVFSTTFRDAPNPAALFGANLIGATLGGFCEYLGMWIGNHRLGYLVLATYAASLLCLLWRRRAAPA
jgi:hypothetical protein